MIVLLCRDRKTALDLMRSNGETADFFKFLVANRHSTGLVCSSFKFIVFGRSACS